MRILLQFGATLLLMALAFAFAPPIFSGDYDTARNYLSTIAATLATILALCISIVLVAIQMTASKYSPRVLDFFIRLPYNASLLPLYLVTIFHCIYILSQVSHQPGGLLPLWLDRAMSADLFLVGCCLLILLNYLYAVLRLMKPQTILLTIEREYFNCYQRASYGDAMDKLEQIADIGKRSLADLDTTTGHLCVVRLSNILSKTNLPHEQGSRIIEYHRKIIRLLLSLASIAYERRELTVSDAVLGELEQMGRRYLEVGSIAGVLLVVDSYQWVITNNLLGSQQQDIIKRVVDLLYELVCGVLEKIDESSMYESFLFVDRTMKSLYELGRKIHQTESYGESLAIELFLTHRFSNVIQKINEGQWSSREREALASECANGYIALATALFQGMTAQDMLLITTWMRTLVVDEPLSPEVNHFYMRLFALFMAAACCQGRRDFVTIAVRSIGKAIRPEPVWFDELVQRRLEIREFFHYQEPEPFLRQIFQLWRAYSDFAQTKAAPASQFVVHGARDNTSDLRGEWGELFI